MQTDRQTYIDTQHIIAYLFFFVTVIPQFDWLCDVCGYVMSPTLGIYWVDLGFIKKMLGHKTLRYKYTATSSRERDELGQELRLQSQFAWTEFAQCLYNLCIVWWLLKQSFYMSRVRRKEGPKTDSQIPRKSELKSKILKSRQIGGVKKLSTSCQILMNLHSCLISWTDLKASTLDPETWFLEVVKHILSLPKYK